MLVIRSPSFIKGLNRHAIDAFHKVVFFFEEAEVFDSRRLSTLSRYWKLAKEKNPVLADLLIPRWTTQISSLETFRLL